MVGCVLGALELEPGAAVLDLACGTGRHSVLLAAAGLRVTGVDLTQEYLDIARTRARRAGQDVRFVRADMRDLSALADRSFDAVVSLHTSLGFFDDDGNRQVLRQVRALLADGGRLCVDVLNRDWFLRQQGVSAGSTVSDFVVTDSGSFGRTTYLHEERFDPLTSRITWTIVEVGAAGIVAADYRVYSAHELVAMLDSSGFTVRALYGDYDLSAFHVHAPHLVVSAIVSGDGPEPDRVAANP